MEYFCNRSDCMFESVKKWRQLAGRKAVPTCTICATRKTDKMRSPGGLLHACRTFFSRLDPKHPEKLPMGSRLEAGSHMCNECYMRGYTFSKTMTTAEKLSVREELKLSGSSQPPHSNSVDWAKHSARLCFLHWLDTGDFVYLEYGVKVYEKARKEANQGGINQRSMVADVQEIMRAMGDTLTDVGFFTFSAHELRSNDSHKMAQYVMPLKVSHVQYAMMHERALEAEAESAKYMEDVRRLKKEAAEIFDRREKAKIAGLSILPL